MDVDVMPLSRGWSYILHISFRTWQRDHSTRLLQSLTNSAGRSFVVPVDGWIKERTSQPDGSMGVKALSPVKRCRFGTSWLWKALGMIENDRLKEKPRMWPNCGKEENNIDPYEIKRRNQKEEKTSGVTMPDYLGKAHTSWICILFLLLFWLTLRPTATFPGADGGTLAAL